jgi:type VI secretion system ImpM family protein
MWSMSGDGAVGVFGKVASQPDFLRAGAGSFSKAGLDRWFQDGMEALRSEKTALPLFPTAFFLVSAESPTAFIGAFSPSVDAAGRSFPLAAFVEVSTAGLSEGLSFLPGNYSSFVTHVASLVSARDLDGRELTAQTEVLCCRPDAPRDWKSELAQPLFDAFGGSPLGIAYAMRTLVTACEQSGNLRSPAASAITIDAPVPIPAASALWIEIARSRLGAGGVLPSFLWTGGSEGRLLMTLGPPSPMALAYLANPRHRSQRLWPLRTTVASATTQALAAISPAQRRAIEDQQISLGLLASAFS